jgi:hypothetical protein
MYVCMSMYVYVCLCMSMYIYVCMSMYVCMYLVVTSFETRPYVYFTKTEGHQVTHNSVSVCI